MEQEREITLPALSDEVCGKENCVEPAIYRCHKCGQLYCLTHASEVEPQYHCIECIKPVDCNVIEMPLVDSEGIRHQGRILKPVGAAFTAESKLIFDLTDEELLDYIKHYTILLREAEQTTSFRRINLSLATHEAVGREIAAFKKVTGEVVFTSGSQTKSVNKAKTVKPKKDSVDVLAATLAKLGYTPEKVVEMLAKMKKKA